MMKQELSIKGWLEVDLEVIPKIKNILAERVQNFENYGISQQKIDIYNDGWCFQEGHKYKVNHVFLGSYVLLRDILFIKEIVQEISLLSKETDGMFFIFDNETGEFSETWLINLGVFKVNSTTFINS